MASIVTIKPAAEGVTCAAGASAEHSFTVTSTAGTTLGIGARVLASDPRQEGWLTLEGKSERTLPAGSTDQFTVTVRVPADARPEPCTFRLLVFSTRQPDEDFTEGPLVSVQVTPAGQPAPPPPPPPFPWWIVAVAVLVLLVGGGLTAWLLWPKGVEVPQVAGLGLKVEEAVQRLEEAGLTFTSETRESPAQPAGIVLEQSPAPGSSVGKGSAVALVVSAAPSQEPTVKVPTVVSLAYEDARRELEEKGLRVERMDPPQATREFRPGQVTAQIPGGNSSARRGDTVRLKVAGESVEVPRLEGQTLQAAIQTLRDRKLVLAEVTGDQESLTAKVERTAPAAGTLVLVGTGVKVHMPAAAGPSPGMELTTDRPGQDYRSFDLPRADPALCQRACAGEAQCRAWTYVKPGVQGSQARCWLKNAVPDARRNDCCVSGVKPVAAGLPTPRLASPPAGASLDAFPRRTVLQWQAVPGAASYTVEVDCLHCCESGKWCTDVGKTFKVETGVRATSYTFDFVGAQPGRWRVSAVDGVGAAGARSEWRDFRYTR